MTGGTALGAEGHPCVTSTPSRCPCLAPRVTRILRSPGGTHGWNDLLEVLRLDKPPDPAGIKALSGVLQCLLQPLCLPCLLDVPCFQGACGFPSDTVTSCPWDSWSLPLPQLTLCAPSSTSLHMLLCEQLFLPREGHPNLQTRLLLVTCVPLHTWPHTLDIISCTLATCWMAGCTSHATGSLPPSSDQVSEEAA